MENKNVQMRDWNGVDFDSLYPVSLGSLIYTDTNKTKTVNERFDILETQALFLESFPIVAPENNDTGRFQRAIDQLVADGGGKLILPKNKTLIVSTSISWKSSNISIVGTFGSIVQPVNCHGFSFGDNTGATRYNYNAFINFKIDMQNALTYNGVISNNVDEGYFNKLIVSQGSIGIQLNGSYNITVVDTICNLQTSVGLSTDCTDKLLIIRGQYGNGETGVKISGGKAITFIGTSIERNNNEAITLNGSLTRGGEYPQGLNFISCYFERNAQIRGNGFISYGNTNVTVGDYCKNIVVSGCYFNWDIGNPRTPSVPFHYFDKVSALTLISNNYSNSTNYSGRTTNTDLNRIIAINDLADMGRGIPRTANNQIWMPFNITVPTDVNGHGTYNYDLTSLKLSSVNAIPVLKTNFSGTSKVSVSFTGVTTMTITVDGVTASSTAEVNGLIIGTQ